MIRAPKSVLFLVAIHAGLALYAAWNQSPAWDEIVYPAAGCDLLKTGRLRTSLDHPPLGKALLALPLYVSGVSLPAAPPGAKSIEPYRYGFNFIYQNPRPARWMTFIPRLTNVLLSCLLAITLYAYASSTWGKAGGILALALYVFSPPVLARASLALLEMPLAFFMTLAVIGAARWRSMRRREDGFIWLLAWTAALLTKANAVVLLPIFLLWDILAAAQKKAPYLRRATETLLVALAALAGAELVMRVFGQSYWIDQLLARRADLTVSRFPIYFHGSYWNSAMFYMAPAAWLMKTPVPFTLLSFGGWAAWRRAHPKDEKCILLTSVFLVTGLAMASARAIIATGQFFYVYPFAALASAAVVKVESRAVQRAIAALLGVLVAGCLWVQPNNLSYFNILVGGSKTGHRWLSDSDQDWGQELPMLASWMQRERLSQILLGYSGAGDPRTYGITYQDVISPAMITTVYRGEVFKEWPGRVVMVLSDKVVQTEYYLLGWLLQNRKPVATVGNTFVAYDLTHDREALAWLAWFYRTTHRPQSVKFIPRT